MKTCPACGYEPTPSKRRLLYLFRKHFRGMPIWEMIQRGWIREVFALDEATSEMMRFFGFKTPSDWNEEFPDLPLPVVLSPDEDAEIQLRIRERQKAGLRYTGTPKEEWSKYPSLPLPRNRTTQA